MVHCCSSAMRLCVSESLADMVNRIGRISEGCLRVYRVDDWPAGIRGVAAVIDRHYCGNACFDVLCGHSEIQGGRWRYQRAGPYGLQACSVGSNSAHREMNLLS